MQPSIFLDFQLPNAATWFYFSLLLVVSLFFQFARPYSIRNLDLLTLFLLVPGLLLIQEGHALAKTDDADRGSRQLIFGYAWLLAGSGYWFVRAIVDLTLVRRPAVSPNLTAAGLACLALALFVGLTAVSVRRTSDPAQQVHVGQRPAPIEQVQDQATAVAWQAQNGTGRHASPDDVRFWVERSLAMICHAAVVVGLLMIGLRHFQDFTAGLAMATLYLLLPYTAYHIGQLHHVWPTVFLVWAIYLYRRPVATGWLLGLATGTTLFPAFLFPLWFGFYARRGAWRFAGAFLSAVVVSVGLTALVMWLAGEAGFGLAAALHFPDWQPWKVPHAESLWRGAQWAYRMPIFVLFVSFLAAVAVWPSPKNLSHLIALSTAVLVGIQFWHADQGGVYVLWYLPLILLMVFRPSLSMAEPPEPGTGLMARWAGAAWRRVRPGPPPPKELAV